MTEQYTGGAHFYARWVQAESVDPNLSTIDTGITNPITSSSQLRFVPKLISVTGLTNTSTVLCTSSPVCIVGVVVGNVALASI